MAQYHRFKREHPDELLFFQMGDFFELFYDDAKLVARELGLTLTSRSKGKDAVPMAGVPVRNVDTYLRRLVEKGYRVAICDQVEDPRTAKGVVRREVTRVVTRGTLIEDDLLEGSAPNFLAALAADGETVGVAFAEVSTGAFVVAECSLEELADRLAERDPAECLLPDGGGAGDDPLERVVRAVLPRAAVTRRPEWEFGADDAADALRSHYGVSSLEGFGLREGSPSVRAAGAALRYLLETQRADLHHLDPPRAEARGERLVLDRATCSCLELVETQRGGRREGTLLALLDETLTAPGARRLRSLVLAPFRHAEAIRERQAAVAWLVEAREQAEAVREALGEVGDVERLLTRVVTRRANPRDLVRLRASLEALPRLREALAETTSAALARAAEDLDPLPELTERLRRALVDEPPPHLAEGGVFRDGYHDELDALRALQRDERGTLAEYQAEESRRTGIPNLKIGFHRVFGYYIEVTHAHRDRVPHDYVRKQTLKNAERYVTPRLQEFERRVLGAEERARALEAELFAGLLDAVAEHTASLKRTAAAIAEIDVHQALAESAVRRRWRRPEIADDGPLVIEGGRHPVIEASLAGGFVPNDCLLEPERRRLGIVTGPNMAGKSTYIRQVAILQILAQMGSFVPADRARVPVRDRVFARVGASDDLSRGHSTFMVEMTETANILNNATERSLVILDEIGRGTSTFDGLALAWAISEHLAGRIRCLGLFATHYHQLTELADREPGVFNLSVQVREWGDDIVFVHRIVEGGSDRSYGIHVARLAGVPRAVLDRAREILAELENEPLAFGPADPRRPRQRSLFEEAPAPSEDPRTREVLDALLRTEPERLTPLEALALLAKWRARLLKEGEEADGDDRGR